MVDTSQLLVFGAVLALGYVFFNGSRGDAREPPVVSSKIPIIGHLLGVLGSGFEYFGTLA